MIAAALVEIRTGGRSEVEGARSLLGACRLPLGGFPEDLAAFFVATIDARISGVVALERHADCGLLRSLAVVPAARGRGVAGRLCDVVETRAGALGLHLFLLTETAAPFFAQRGYEPCDRRFAPAGIRASREFAELCPASAVLMKLAR